jgi:hypothetical protein
MSSASLKWTPGPSSRPQSEQFAMPSQETANVAAHAAARAPLAERFNFRVIVFVGVVAVLLGWPIYYFVHETITQGVVNHGDYSVVNLKAMGYFPLDPLRGNLADIPKVYRELDGKRVVLGGQIAYPDSAGSAVNQFQLVWNIVSCCFGGPPKVQERVFARTLGGHRMIRPVGDDARVTGFLHVKLKRDETGSIVSVYEMDVEKIENP